MAPLSAGEAGIPVHRNQRAAELKEELGKREQCRQAVGQQQELGAQKLKDHALLPTSKSTEVSSVHHQNGTARGF